MPADGPRDYEVGYGKPPVAKRFKKGNAANRRGRPRGSKNLATLLERALDEPVVIAENGERRKLTKRDLVIEQLVNKSAQADLRATKLLFEILGKVDPRAVAAPADAEASSLADEAIEQVREKLARLARDEPASGRPARGHRITHLRTEHHHFATGLVRFHHPVRFPNILEAEHSRWFRFIATSGHLIGDGLKWNIRQREARFAEHKTAEEAEVDTARHLQQRVEVGHRIKPSQKARQAGAPTPSKHGEGIQDRAVADQVENGVDPFPFGDALR
jgi:hypothetical protein